MLHHVRRVLERKSPYADADAFAPGAETTEYVRDIARVLVIGAGGLGCEILKGLAYSGFRNIDVIDLDTIDVTNLNRQFLFRQTDVGKAKATAAAAFINERCRHMGVRVTAHVGKIQERDDAFYRQFNIIVAGLDNIPARRWMNSTLYSMVQKDADGNPDPATIIPLLDGGTEGLKGQARVIVPYLTSCFDCSLDSFPPQVNFPLCTIAETPRLPEHCIEYALVVLWEKSFPNKKVNNDSPEDMQWLFQQAKERADAFGIAGVTYQLTMGVVKRIIPAVASTNALIAAALVQECLKIQSYCGPVLTNYLMYMGQTGVYTYTFEYEKNPNCMVCGGKELVMEVSSKLLLKELLEKLGTDPRYQLTRPSVTGSKGVIFMGNPAVLRKAHEHKLEKSLGELFEMGVLVAGEPLTVTDPTLPSKLQMTLKLT